MFVPIYVKYFCWKLIWQCLPSKYLLASMRIILGSFTTCDLCPNILGDSEHFTIVCIFMQDYWLALAHFLTAFRSSSLSDLLAFLMNIKIEMLARAVTIYMALLIWDARNDHLF